MLKFAKAVPIAAVLTLSASFMFSNALAQKAPAAETQNSAIGKQIDPIDAEQRPVAKSAAGQSAQKQKKASACQYLAKTDCERKTGCGWIMPKKNVDKRGRNLQAYCRTTARASKQESDARQTAQDK